MNEINNSILTLILLVPLAGALLVAIAPGNLLRRLERFLRFYGKFVKSCGHGEHLSGF